MTVYVDVLFLLNFITACILYWSVATVFGMKIKPSRYILCGIFTGVYAVLEALLLIPTYLRVVVLTLSICMVFGFKGLWLNLIRVSAFGSVLLVLVTVIAQCFGFGAMVRGGSVVLFTHDAVAGIFVFCVYPVAVFGIRKWRDRRRWRNCMFKIGDATIYARLMYDSGNLLRDNGKNVAVISNDLVKHIDMGDTKNFVELKSVSGTDILPLVDTDKAVVDGVVCDLKLAVTDMEFKECGGIIGI